MANLENTMQRVEKIFENSKEIAQNLEKFPGSWKKSKKLGQIFRKYKKIGKNFKKLQKSETSDTILQKNSEGLQKIVKIFAKNAKILSKLAKVKKKLLRPAKNTDLAAAKRVDFSRKTLLNCENISNK